MSVKKIMRFIAFLLMLFGITLIYWIKDYMVMISLISTGVFLFAISFIPKKDSSNLNLASFINVFTHFRVALDSEANVYQALSAALTVTNGKLYETLEELINAIEVDHSVTPFISFAKPFNHRFVTHIMINIYMLINHGLEQKRMWQFNFMFETLVKEFNDEQLALHESSYERFLLSLFLGNAIMIFTLMSAAMAMIGAF